MKDSISVDNAVKDPNFVNGVYQAPNDDLEYSTQEFLMEPGPTPKAPAEVDGKDSNTTATVEGNTTTQKKAHRHQQTHLWLLAILTAVKLSRTYLIEEEGGARESKYTDSLMESSSRRNLMKKSRSNSF